MTYSETKNRDQIKKTFTAFLDYCQNGYEDEVTRSTDNGAMPFYPLGINKEQREALEEMGEEIIRQMPDDIIDKLMNRNGSTSFVAKVFPKDEEPYIMHNEYNAGYIVHCLVFSAISAAQGDDNESPRTFAKFCTGVPQALKWEFPFYDWDAAPEPEPEPGPAPVIKPETLLTLSEMKPKKAVFPNSLVAQSLTRPELWGGEWKRDGMPGFPIKELRDQKTETYVSLSLDSILENGIAFDREITSYDLSVSNALCTFYECGNFVFTPRQLCVQMKLLENDNSGVDAASIKEITESLEKGRRTMILIDATSTFEKRNITDYGFVMDDQFFPLKKGYAIGKGPKSGELIEVYYIRDEPPILQHAKATGQIIRAPVENLKIEGMSITNDVVILRDYLFKRICAAKEKHLTRKILYSTIYAVMDIAEPSLYRYTTGFDEETQKPIIDEAAYKKDLDRYRHDTKSVRDKVKKLMENWKKKGVIAEYTESKKGKTLEGVTISFGQEKKPKKGK